MFCCCADLIELSATFDMIDHAFLLSRSRDMYGIREHALVWIKSYLSYRLQWNVKGTLSDKELNFCDPQGSVLAPILYCLYTKPVSSMTELIVFQSKHNINIFVEQNIQVSGTERV